MNIGKILLILAVAFTCGLAGVFYAGYVAGTRYAPVQPVVHQIHHCYGDGDGEWCRVEINYDDNSK